MKYILRTLVAVVFAVALVTSILYWYDRCAVPRDGTPHVVLDEFLGKLTSLIFVEGCTDSIHTDDDLMRCINEHTKLRELVNRPEFRRYWKNGRLIDPWGHEMRWEESLKYVYSIGPNGIDEHSGGDDVH